MIADERFYSVVSISQVIEFVLCNLYDGRISNFAKALCDRSSLTSMAIRTMHWWLYPRNKPALLWAFMAEFQTNSKLSLEGDLQEFDLLERSDASTEETPALRRRTTYPVQEFVVLPITADVTAALKRNLAGPGIFGQGGALVHVQIENEGRLVFGAYDNFHKDCVVAFHPVPEALLARLQCNGVMRAFEQAG